uniref:Uncharacterized protein n=1 Tax=viral metagenome TaxID=1070528 RepID=A0A6C0BD72_9ZZZZ
MSSEQINKNSSFVLENGGIIRSVSIILYDPIRGYLFCDEYRKGFPNTSVKTLNSHLPGGKVEMNDSTPLQTGIREFCEEVPYNYFGHKVNATVSILLSGFESCKKRYRDIIVSVPKNLYNRFYIINISEIVDKNLRESLYSCIDNWRVTEGSVIENLFFWKVGDELKTPPSPLLNDLIKILPNESTLYR